MANNLNMPYVLLVMAQLLLGLEEGSEYENLKDWLELTDKDIEAIDLYVKYHLEFPEK